MSNSYDDETSFSGVYPAVLTPLNSDLSINYDELVKHINDLINHGCNGVVLFGTTGEGTSFSVNERIETIEAVIKRGINSKLIIVGVGCSSIDDAVEITRASVEFNCSSVLMHPPYYFKNLKDEGIINFYREVIKRVAKPQLKLFLYHIPQFTYAPISLNVIGALKNEFPQTVIGIKDSAGVFDFTRSILRTFPGFKVILGSEVTIPNMIRSGATGVVSGLANVCPELICNQFNAAKDSTVNDKENDVKYYLDLLNDNHFISALKGLMSFKSGSAWTRVRYPLLPLNENETNELLKKSKN